MRFKTKEAKGITLIALVITIIVLLILAGVAIATLTGENGILTKANNAKIETTKAGAEEKVKIAVLASYGQHGGLDYEVLEKNLNKIEGKTSQIPSPITKDSFPIVVTVDGYNVKIKEDGFTGIIKNSVSDMFDSTGKIEGKMHIGDFINYEAGTWTEDEMNSIDATGKASTSGNNHQFVGFTVGTSRDENALAYSYKSSYSFIQETKSDGTKSDITGWRVFNVSDDGTLTLISAGFPEAYQHQGSQNDGYISEYILTGNINESATDLNLESNYVIRDWSMYVNKTYGANSARALTKTDLDLWYGKYKRNYKCRFK